ncbi:hypothetical protein JCM9957A_61400 [Kineosporia succinea]
MTTTAFEAVDLLAGKSTCGARSRRRPSAEWVRCPEAATHSAILKAHCGTIADRLLCQLHADMALTSETKCSHGLPVRLVAIETIGGKL